MYTAIILFKAVIEVSLYAYVGQFILFIVAGNRRHNNFVFSTLKLITSPMEKVVRFVSPALVLDRHIPLATSMLLLTAWLGLTIAKANIVIQQSAK